MDNFTKIITILNFYLEKKQSYASIQTFQHKLKKSTESINFND